MKVLDGQILEGGVVKLGGEGRTRPERLLPLKIVQNKYKHKEKEPKRKLLTPRKNESISDFCKRVDSDSRQYQMERDKQALKAHRSMKNKKKREKRALKSLEKSQSKGSNLSQAGELEYAFSPANTKRPSFGDVIDSPPSFSPKTKDKLEKAKKETKARGDLSEYVQQVRKAYSDLKNNRISESNRLFERRNKGLEKSLTDFGDGWVGIGKFKRQDE